MSDNNKLNNEVPIFEKYALTIKEATKYFGIGDNKLRQIINDNKTADFVLWIGTHYIIKRRLFEQFLDKALTI